MWILKLIVIAILCLLSLITCRNRRHHDLEKGVVGQLAVSLHEVNMSFFMAILIQ